MHTLGGDVSELMPAVYKGSFGKMMYDKEAQTWRILLIGAQCVMFREDTAEAMMICDHGTNCLTMFYDLRTS